MMTKILTIFSSYLLLTLFSCKTDKQNNNLENTDTLLTEKNAVKNKVIVDSLIGEYRGEFGTSTIIFSLSYINLDNGIASGYNIVRGNRRNIKGTVEEKNDILYLKLSEPGDNKYDGVFNITLKPDMREIEGTWTPNDEKNAKSKTMLLKKIMKLKPDDDIEGDWFLNYEEYNNDAQTEDYSHGTITFKKDGACYIEISKYDYEREKYNKETLKGTWLKNDKTITLEIQPNKILKKSKFNLNYIEDSEMGSGYYKGDKLMISKWFY